MGDRHGVQMEQFSRLDQEEKEASDGGEDGARPPARCAASDVAQRMMIPADIAQILSRIR